MDISIVTYLKTEMGENSSGHKKIVESPSATQASNMGKSAASTLYSIHIRKEDIKRRKIMKEVNEFEDRNRGRKIIRMRNNRKTGKDKK